LQHKACVIKFHVQIQYVQEINNKLNSKKMSPSIKFPDSSSSFFQNCLHF
jgi:hypothetical protein